MPISDRDLYGSVLSAVAPREWARLPRIAVNKLIDKSILDQDVSITPVPKGAHNTSHVDALQLLHDIIVFTGIVIATYHPGRRTRSPPEGLSEAQKKQIEEIVRSQLSKPNDAGDKLIDEK